ncbi:MAG: hypothetical protein LBH59_11300 [Planctomycetaceae bacterium]|nr:hypothetical protein [Planctomycetaceae bacterium]
MFKGEAYRPYRLRYSLLKTFFLITNSILIYLSLSSLLSLKNNDKDK